MIEPTHFLNGKVRLFAGDCREMVKRLADASIDSVVTDPPYALVSIGKRFGKDGATPSKPGKSGAYARASAGFMGKRWDTGEVAFDPEFWAEVLRVLKPGGHVVAFGGTRSYHRLACAIEDAGFEIRDCIMWLYGSGFPKSHDIAKAIDKRGGHHRGKRGMPVPFRSSAKGQEYERTEKGPPVLEAAMAWSGWGTALKPAVEPIVLARKPLAGTVAETVLAHGTGGLNIGACRVLTGADEDLGRNNNARTDGTSYVVQRETLRIDNSTGKGRWPANILHDGSDEVLAAFPDTTPARAADKGVRPAMLQGDRLLPDGGVRGHDDAGGSAARFFASFPRRDEECLSTSFASDADRHSLLGKEAVDFALRSAVEASTPGLALKSIAFPEHFTSVTESELRLSETSVTETIRCLELKSWLGLPRENTMVALGPVRCAATPRQTGITTITISRLMSGHFVELATFDITHKQPELGAKASQPRLFYSSKADAHDRIGSKHPTVKPVDLMQWLCRLITPPGGTVLDPFAGSGTTGEAAFREGFAAVLIEREAEYQADIARRMELALAGPDERARESLKARGRADYDAGPLFGGSPDAAGGGADRLREIRPRRTIGPIGLKK